MEEFTPATTPIEENLKLEKGDKEERVDSIVACKTFILFLVL